MSEDERQPANASDKALRMAEIRQNRREAGFSEVTVWLPNEYIREFRDWAWEIIDKAATRGRSFPHRTRGPLARRRRRK